jgi:hypothetical protein
MNIDDRYLDVLEAIYKKDPQRFIQPKPLLDGLKLKMDELELGDMPKILGEDGYVENWTGTASSQSLPNGIYDVSLTAKGGMLLRKNKRIK